MKVFIRTLVFPAIVAASACSAAPPEEEEEVAFTADELKGGMHVSYHHTPIQWSAFSCQTDPNLPDFGTCNGTGTWTSVFEGSWRGSSTNEITVKCTEFGAVCDFHDDADVTATVTGCGKARFRKVAVGTTKGPPGGEAFGPGKWWLEGKTHSGKTITGSGTLTVFLHADLSADGTMSGNYRCRRCD